MPSAMLAEQAAAMSDTLPHRGPDDSGVWVDSDAGVGLGFRRLAIVELTHAGRQPMISASGQYVICFNGEIYNAEDVRWELDQVAVPRWRGHSDTEVLLEACAAWGVLAALKRVSGMFAFALYDRATRKLYLARDCVGKKPLYWTFQNNLLIFGSELRSIRAHRSFRGVLDRDALASFLRYGYVMYPYTIYKHVHQLSPGHVLTFQDGSIEEATFWSHADALAAARSEPFQGDAEKAIDALDGLLGDAVRRRMIADVPLGAFLSGGYDSSTVVALMQKASTRPVRTFSIGFHDSRFDESRHAREIARHLATDHTELIVTPSEARDVIQYLPDIYDEPFADASQIPTYLVSKLARRDVTVALSGDGGDEVFMGYNRYIQGELFSKRISRLPLTARRFLSNMMQMLTPGQWDAIFSLVPERGRIRLPGDKMFKMADVLAENHEGFYRKLASVWDEPERVVIGAREPRTIATDTNSLAFLPDFIERMQYSDMMSFLPGDILTKVDRASMAVSLEVRSPILDTRVIEFAWSLPRHMKIRNGQGKWLLRQLAHRYCPAKLLDRPKTGFGLPIGDWLRGPLREWAEELLDEQALKACGIFEPTAIRVRWREHLSGRRNWEQSIWTILMFETWRRAYGAH